MKRKQQIKNVKSNENQPATQGDLSLWGGRLQEQITDLQEDVTELKEGQTRIESKVDNLETDVGHLKRSQETILEVVKSIDQQLREHKTHPDRFTRLERSVFRR